MVEICIKLFVEDLGLFFIIFDFAAIYYKTWDRAF